MRGFFKEEEQNKLTVQCQEKACAVCVIDRYLQDCITSFKRTNEDGLRV